MQPLRAEFDNYLQGLEEVQRWGMENGGRLSCSHLYGGYLYRTLCSLKSWFIFLAKHSLVRGGLGFAEYVDLPQAELVWGLYGSGSVHRQFILRVWPCASPAESCAKNACYTRGTRRPSRHGGAACAR